MISPCVMANIIKHLMHSSNPYTGKLEYSEPPKKSDFTSLSQYNIAYSAFMVNYDKTFRFYSPYGVSCTKNYKFKTYRDIIEEITTIDNMLNASNNKIKLMGGYMQIDQSFWS